MDNLPRRDLNLGVLTYNGKRHDAITLRIIRSTPPSRQTFRNSVETLNNDYRKYLRDNHIGQYLYLRHRHQGICPGPLIV